VYARTNQSHSKGQEVTCAANGAVRVRASNVKAFRRREHERLEPVAAAVVAYVEGDRRRVCKLLTDLVGALHAEAHHKVDVVVVAKQVVLLVVVSERVGAGRLSARRGASNSVPKVLRLVAQAARS